MLGTVKTNAFAPMVLGLALVVGGMLAILHVALPICAIPVLVGITLVFVVGSKCRLAPGQDASEVRSLIDRIRPNAVFLWIWVSIVAVVVLGGVLELLGIESADPLGFCCAVLGALIASYGLSFLIIWKLPRTFAPTTDDPEN